MAILEENKVNRMEDMINKTDLINLLEADNQFHQLIKERIENVTEWLSGLDTFQELDENDKLCYQLGLTAFSIQIAGVKKVKKYLKDKIKSNGQLARVIELTKPIDKEHVFNEADRLYNDAMFKIFADEKWLSVEMESDIMDRYEFVVSTLEHLKRAELKTEKAKENFGQVLETVHKKFKQEKDSLIEEMNEQNISIPEKVVKKEPTRGIETMFRTTSKSHLELSAMADNKANILLSISAILLSLILSTLASKLDTNPILLMPTIIILIVALTTVIFATIATIPNVTKNRITREDVDAKRGNLLFFGNFSRMPLADYEYGMKELMKDRDYLYDSMIQDIYFLGIVLEKKYRNLRIAYNVFMYGLVVATIAFVISFSMQ